MYVLLLSVCRFVRMWRCCKNAGGRAKCMCGLLITANLVIILVIMTRPRVAVFPYHFLETSTVSTTNSSLTTLFVEATQSPTVWGRLATFYILTGRQGDYYISELVAEAAEDWRSLPTNTTSSECQRPVDVYLLYSSDEELISIQASLNINRY